MTLPVGASNTAGFTTDLAKKSFSSMITRLMPNGSATLYGLTSMLKEETAVAIEHGYFSKTMIFPEVVLNGAILDGVDTTFTGVDTSNLLPGMILEAQTTGEQLLVLTVPSATTFTVQRGAGTTAAAAIADAVTLHQIGTAFEESSDRPNAMNINPVRMTNLTQIFRNTWAVSGTAAAVQTIAGDGQKAENREDCAVFHATDIEKGIIFGEKFDGTLNGQPFRKMDGLISMTSNLSYYPPSYLAANVTTMGATTNFTQLEAAIDPVFNQTTDPKGANERILLVGGIARKVINNIGRLNGTYQLVDGQTDYGLQFSTFKLARGTVRVIEHPLFNANPYWSAMGLVVDIPTFNVAHLIGRKTLPEEFGSDGRSTDNGLDAKGGSLTTELTTVCKNVAANAVMYNFTAAAVG